MATQALHYMEGVAHTARALLDEGSLHLSGPLGLELDMYSHAYITVRDTVLAMIFMGIVDLAGVRLSGARYYILHSLINALVVYCVAEDFFALVTDPLGAGPDIHHNPLPLVYAIHLYHVMFFADLTPVDWAHHIINVLIMGVIAECWEWGKGVNATCFIMNGVPGGIDYMLLTLVKHGLMHSMTEKKLNTYLNMVIRFPGMTIVAYIMFICRWHGKLHVPWWLVATIVVLEWGNALYFAQRVVGNYYVRSHVSASATPKGDDCSAGDGTQPEEEEEFH